jgi:3-methyladenine DNA glycosylase AlkD
MLIYENMILEELLKNRDEEYRKFHSSLIPGTQNVLGVRAPVIKSIAKKYAAKAEAQHFLESLPHRYYDENMVHGYMLGFLNEDTSSLRAEIEALLPYMDNWAVVDSTVSNLKNFFKSPCDVYDFVCSLTKSKHTYTCRFGLVSLLNYYVDKEHVDEILKIVTSIKSEEYYIKMAQAWLVSVCIVKEYDKTVKILEKNLLDIWTHNKSISKSIESFRVSSEQKNYLKSLRRKNEG